MNKKNDNILDIVKYIMSLFIIAIHVELYPNYLFPWLRIAVPLFFVISSYIFFKKYNKLDTNKEKKDMIIKFIKRNIILYLFYFIILLPYTIIENKYYVSFTFIDLCKLIQKILFQEGYPSAWFITANLKCILITCLIKDKIKDKLFILISIIMYLLPCIVSGYPSIIENNILIYRVYELYQKIFLQIQFSPFSGLYFTYLGLYFASNKDLCISKLTNSILLLVVAILFYIEFFITFKMGAKIGHDCYILLIIVIPLVFNIIKDIKLNINYNICKYLRTISIISYCIHIPIINIVRRVFKVQNNIYVYLLTILIVTIISIIEMVSERTIKFLKYTH